LNGQVVASFGRRYLVELDDATSLDCVTRARRGSIACGDRVNVTARGPGQGVIEAVARRTTLLYRSDQVRQKLVAANVTQIVIVVAPLPAYHEELVNRCLAAAEHGGMAALIALNKSDLEQAPETLRALEPYRRLGYRVVALSAKRDRAPLAPHLKGQTSVLVGQSGVGKSTLINALIPAAAVRVAELSAALDAGRHTTTHARLYHLDDASHIIDSPGMQEFGLHHLGQDGLEQAFIEFRLFLGQCRFRDCRHMTEPGCAIAAASKRGEISERRLASYRGLVRERREL
jgi:ribosome biogenesis GTPase